MISKVLDEMAKTQKELKEYNSIVHHHDIIRLTKTQKELKDTITGEPLGTPRRQLKLKKN